MADLCNLQIHVNGQHTFFLNQKIVSAYSGTLRKMIKQGKKTTHIENFAIALDDFPGAADGFELVSRFCYNNGRIPITILNVSILYCAAIYLGMTDKVSRCNLLQKSETFLEGMFDWCWGDLLICLRSCEPFFPYADSSGLIDKLITALLAKIAQNSDISLHCSSNSSSQSSCHDDSGSSPNLSKPLSSSSTNKSDGRILQPPGGAVENPVADTQIFCTDVKHGGKNKGWWFDDLATLSPMIIEKLITNLGAYGSDNNSLLLTKFLLHYLKTARQCKKSSSNYSKLADTVVYGVILLGKTAFSCRALFWVLRLVSGFGLSKICRTGLEKMIGDVLDLAKLDDLLVSGHNSDGEGGVYDVNIVVRLIRVFIQCEGISLQRLKKVSWLIDQFLAEISPDQNLKMSKFMGVVQSLPDLARDCFDGVYRAIDIYLESHATLTFEERSRLCQCLNYEKLSLATCKELAKNPRIPPRIAVQALASQKYVTYELPTKIDKLEYYGDTPTKNGNNKQIVIFAKGATYHEEEDQKEGSSILEGSEDMRLNIQRMQWRVLELERMCKEMKSQMTRLVRYNKSINSPPYNRPPRLC